MQSPSAVSVQSNNMKRLYEILTAFLCIDFITSVFTFYIYDENPNIGFDWLENSGGTFVSGYNMAKKQFIGSYSPRYQKYTNEHMADSHFKVVKTPSIYTLPTLMNGNQRGGDSRMTSVKVWRQNIAPAANNPGNVQQLLLKNTQNISRTAKTMHGKPIHTLVSKDAYIIEQIKTAQKRPQQEAFNNPPIRPKAVNADYSGTKKSLPRAQDEMSRAKSVQMYVQKAQISLDAQKVVRGNYSHFPSTTLRYGAQQSQHQRVPSSMLMDKTLHKSNGLNDHHLMARVLNDMTQQAKDTLLNKEREYRKRDIKTTLDLYDNPLFDNMRKYIGKDKDSVKAWTDRMGINKEVARIGSNHEEGLQLTNTPYALFYRMNPEDQQEAFILLSSMEKQYSNTKTKETEQPQKSPIPRKQKTNTNALILHKKIRNYASSRHA